MVHMIQCHQRRVCRTLLSEVSPVIFKRLVNEQLTCSSIVLSTLPIAAKLRFIPMVLERPSALRYPVCNMPRIYLVSRPSVVKVLAYGLLDVVVISLHTLAANTVEALRQVTFNRNMTSDSCTSGTKLRKASISSRDGWKEPAIISS
jgi:hypothetical protein